MNPFEAWANKFTIAGAPAETVEAAFSAASGLDIEDWLAAYGSAMNSAFGINDAYNAARYRNLVKSTDQKPTNPKDAIGVSKAPISVVPTPFIHALGLAMLEGSLKYGRHNYRSAGIRYGVYYDAMMRHMNAWWEGEDIDPDSGLPHPVKAAACCAILFDAILRQNGNDDRPPKSPEGWMADMNKKTEELLEQYPNPVEAFREVPPPAEN